ncbi:MAG TPA: fasciclin domain-containing protein [Methylocella sp.]|nr:fasciclin domain-containing protein [Methylocella sp.]
MSPFFKAALAATLGFGGAGSAALLAPCAELSVEVGGAPMLPSRSILENIVNSKDHTTWLNAIQAADLAETLQGEGPFTLLAPVNKAFDKLPKGTLESWLLPENKPALTAILTYHVIQGRIAAADFIAAIEKGNGSAAYQTVEGEMLTVRHDGRRLEFIDAKGNRSFVTLADVLQRNGVIHIIDSVLLPKG